MIVFSLHMDQKPHWPNAQRGHEGKEGDRDGAEKRKEEGLRWKDEAEREVSEKEMV